MARKLVNKSNVDILNAIRGDASLDYTRRVPEATRANIQQTLAAITNYRPLWNEFLDSLVNRIGTVIVRSELWDNPLAMFKSGQMTNGDTVEELGIGLLNAKVYNPDTETDMADLFAKEVPYTESNFHRINRQDRYDLTVNDILIRRAFLEESGLSNYVAGLMSAPATSDSLDEFNLMAELLPMYEQNGGYWHVHVDDLSRATGSTVADQARDMLRKVRSMVGNLQFLSTKYNAARMPISAQSKELILLASPEVQAALDVDALAAAFNIERAEIPTKIVLIPQEKLNFGGQRHQAILTTSDFFQVYDTVLENASFNDPASLSTKYFLHHHQIISCSRFVPAISFWTGTDDEAIVLQPIRAWGLTTTRGDDSPVVTPVTRGDMVEYVATAEPATADHAVVWGVLNARSPRTFITQNGVLHVAVDETAAEIIVTSTTVELGNENVPLVSNTVVPLIGEIEGWSDQP